MRSPSALLLTLLAAMNIADAAAPAVPCPPVPGASRTVATAPTSPTERLVADARPAAESRTDGVAVPQVAVPLRRGKPDATALKPGKLQAKTAGQVDDGAARCRAARP